MPPTLPSVSVVIPCFNDAGVLEACLRSLRNQTLDPLQIVVVDNNCTDASTAVARRYGAEVVSEPVQGIPAAAAAGYDAARGAIIARCDADSVLPADWIHRLAEFFAAEPDVDVVSGPGAFYGLPRPLGALLSSLYLGSYYAAMGPALAHRPFFGSNLALRSTAWDRVRGSVHRGDAEMHDDVCLSLHMGLDFSCRYDRSLRVGISPRALQGRANVARRFRRAFHTLAAHWPQEYPWRRWQRRFSGPVPRT